MHWHHAFVCTRTLHDIGCECIVCYVSVNFGKSTPCLVSINCLGDMVRSTLVGVDGGLSGMGHRPN